MLKPLELEICQQLGDVWNNFLKLDQFHPSERAEFMKAIHDAQNIVMARSAYREHPTLFHGEPKGGAK